VDEQTNNVADAQDAADQAVEAAREMPEVQPLLTTQEENFETDMNSLVEDLIM
jgi:hypothetical protein